MQQLYGGPPSVYAHTDNTVSAIYITCNKLTLGLWCMVGMRAGTAARWEHERC